MITIGSRVTPVPAVLLDRDGVIVEEGSGLNELRVIAGVPEALAAFRARGLKIAVITNQTVISRGLLSRDDVDRIHARLQTRLLHENPHAVIDGFFVCPHHPSATVAALRLDCACRKPKPGLLLQAAQELGLDLSRSLMAGDRLTDLAAGQAVGCLTALVNSTATAAPPIETSAPFDPTTVRVDVRCGSLLELSRWPWPA